jgi:hypothetical protein
MIVMHHCHSQPELVLVELKHLQGQLDAVERSLSDVFRVICLSISKITSLEFTTAENVFPFIYFIQPHQIIPIRLKSVFFSTLPGSLTYGSPAYLPSACRNVLIATGNIGLRWPGEPQHPLCKITDTDLPRSFHFLVRRLCLITISFISVLMYCSATEQQ